MPARDHDGIPPERRAIVNYTSRLGDDLRVLSAGLARWAARSGDGPDAPARRAANIAMHEVDDMLAELHQLRARLVTEIRVSDDQTAVRADQLLARHRGVSP